jgi:hypothetical protein
MRTLFIVLAAASLAACGVETATTAATAAEIKKREVQQGQQTMDAAKQKIEAATKAAGDRAAQSGGDKN